MTQASQNTSHSIYYDSPVAYSDDISIGRESHSYHGHSKALPFRIPSGFIKGYASSDKPSPYEVI